MQRSAKLSCSEDSEEIQPITKSSLNSSKLSSQTRRCRSYSQWCKAVAAGKQSPLSSTSTTTNGESSGLIYQKSSHESKQMSFIQPLTSWLPSTLVRSTRSSVKLTRNTRVLSSLTTLSQWIWSIATGCMLYSTKKRSLISECTSPRNSSSRKTISLMRVIYRLSTAWQYPCKEIYLRFVTSRLSIFLCLKLWEMRVSMPSNVNSRSIELRSCATSTTLQLSIICMSTSSTSKDARMRHVIVLDLTTASPTLRWFQITIKEQLWPTRLAAKCTSDNFSLRKESYSLKLRKRNRRKIKKKKRNQPLRAINR